MRHEIEYWEDEYNNAVDFFERNINRLPGVFVGFNVNIDAVKHLSEEDLENLGMREADPDRLPETPGVISSYEEFLCGLARSMRSGRAMEWSVHDHDVHRTILRKTGWDRKRIGGQAGIVSNLLSRIGCHPVVLCSPGLSMEEAGMLDERVFIPRNENGRLVLENAKSLVDPRKRPRINIILEFREGMEVKTRRGSLRVPRSNRFIVSHRVSGRHPLVPREIEAVMDDISRETGLFFVSGYQHLGTSDMDFFRARSQLLEMRNSPNSRGVHFEFTSEEDPRVLERIRDYILGAVDSMGLNERETCLLLRALGEEGLAREIEQDGYSAFALYRGAKRIMKRTGIRRMHVHNLGFFVLVQDKELSTWKAAKRALLLAGSFVLVKSIEEDIFFPEEVEEERFFPISVRGVKEIERFEREMVGRGLGDMIAPGCFDDGEHYVVVVPGKEYEGVRTTVGLGDTISSIGFVTTFLS